MIEIKSITGAALYKSETATTLVDAVVEAVKARANLSGANLSGADLSGAYLSRADLSRAYLFGANLSRAYLSRAYLSGANLFGADLAGADLFGADLSGAYLFGANLSRAYLAGADLFGADLSRADLFGADFSRADLSGADLSGAYLSRADLSRAKGLNKLLTTPLYLLLDQPGEIRAYKLVTADGYGPFNGGVQYTVGGTVEIPDANCNEQVARGAGINVASLDWCLREWQQGYRVLVVEFTRDDIACIPVGSDGKFRLRRCRVVAEKTLEELGLSNTEKKNDA